MPAKFVANTMAPNPDRDPLEFYRTARALVRAIADLEGPFPGLTWDPACGDGRFGEEWERRRWRMLSTDVAQRGYGRGGVDYLSAAPPARLRRIVVNPPFRKARAFVEKALDDLPPDDGVLCVLERLNFIESEERFEFFHDTRLTRIWISAERHSCHAAYFDPEGKKKEKGSAVCFAWFVWDLAARARWPGYFETRLFRTDGERTVVLPTPLYMGQRIETPRGTHVITHVLGGKR